MQQKYQKNNNNNEEIEKFEFIKTKEAKRYVSKELTFHDFDKYLYDITNRPITKEQMSFINYNHKNQTVTNNWLSILSYPHGTNIPFTEYFPDKYTPSSTAELNKIYNIYYMIINDKVEEENKTKLQSKLA